MQLARFKRMQNLSGLVQEWQERRCQRQEYAVMLRAEPHDIKTAEPCVLRLRVIDSSTTRRLRSWRF